MEKTSRKKPRDGGAGGAKAKRPRTSDPLQKRNCLCCQFTGVDTAQSKAQFFCQSIMQPYKINQERPSRIGYRHVIFNNIGLGLESSKKSKMQASLLRHLPPGAGQELKKNPDRRYYIGVVHYPPEVTLSVSSALKGRLKFPTTVPKQLGDMLRKKYAISYSTIDLFDANTYIVVPNFSRTLFIQESKCLPIVLSSPGAVSSSSSSSTASSTRAGVKRRNWEVSTCKDHPGLASQKISEMSDILEQQDRTIQKQKIENDLLKNENKRLKTENKGLKIETNQLKEKLMKKNHKKFDIMMQQTSGLSRFTLTSDLFHRTHPLAAKVLFGFKNWKTTKRMLKVLFAFQSIGKPPTRHHLRENKPINNYEKCLIALMRIEMA